MGSLTYVQAQSIVEKAMAHARQMGIKPVTIVVLDDAAQMIASGREDGATGFRHEIALGKAWASVSMGSNSRQLGVMASKVPHFFGSLSALAQGKFVPHTGGVLIRNDAGTIIGSAGASGGTGDEDEEILIVAIKAAGLTAG